MAVSLKNFGKLTSLMQTLKTKFEFSFEVKMLRIVIWHISGGQYFYLIFILFEFKPPLSQMPYEAFQQTSGIKISSCFSIFGILDIK